MPRHRLRLALLARRALGPGAVALALASTDCVVEGDVLQDEGTTGTPADGCTGMDRDGCANQQGICVAIWGTPYVQDPNNEWCLFSNGLEFLGCREASACTQAALTVCSDTSEESWALTYDCVPAELDATVCEPPVENAPLC